MQITLNETMCKRFCGIYWFMWLMRWSVLLWRWFFTKIPNIRHPIRYWHTYLRSLRTHPTNKTKKIIPFLLLDTQFLYFIYFFHLHFATQLFFISLLLLLLLLFQFCFLLRLAVIFAICVQLMILKIFSRSTK